MKNQRQNKAARKAVLSACMLWAACRLTGCGTLGSISQGDLGVYSGVKEDVILITDSLEYISRMDSGHRIDRTLGCGGCIFLPFQAVGLVVSFLADTLLLPYTGFLWLSERAEEQTAPPHTVEPGPAAEPDESTSL